MRDTQEGNPDFKQKKKRYVRNEKLNELIKKIELVTKRLDEAEEKHVDEGQYASQTRIGNE